MTDHIARLYALTAGSVVFLVTWAGVAANPFPEATSDPDPRVVALQKREERLAREQKRVNRIVERRFAAYRRKLADRQSVNAAIGDTAAQGAATSPQESGFPPAQVQITSLPPVTSSGSS